MLKDYKFVVNAIQYSGTKRNIELINDFIGDEVEFEPIDKTSFNMSHPFIPNMKLHGETKDYIVKFSNQVVPISKEEFEKMYVLDGKNPRYGIKTYKFPIKAIQYNGSNDNIKEISELVKPKYDLIVTCDDPSKYRLKSKKTNTIINGLSGDYIAISPNDGIVRYSARSFNEEYIEA